MKKALLIGSLGAGLLSGAATASEFKQFRDWYAACDNLRNCSAYGFDTELLGGGISYLRIERSGAPDAAAKISITAEVPNGSKFKLRFNDPLRLPGLPSEPQTGGKSTAATRRGVSRSPVVRRWSIRFARPRRSP